MRRKTTTFNQHSTFQSASSCTLSISLQQAELYLMLSARPVFAICSTPCHLAAALTLNVQSPCGSPCGKADWPALGSIQGLSASNHPPRPRSSLDHHMMLDLTGSRTLLDSIIICRRIRPGIQGGREPRESCPFRKAGERNFIPSSTVSFHEVIFSKVFEHNLRKTRSRG